MINIGTKIYQAVRLTPGLSSRDFAKKINVTEGYVQKIYKKQHIDTSLLEQIAIVLNRPISYFFGDSYIQKEPTLNIVSEPNETEMDCRKQLEIAQKEIQYLQEINLLLREKAKK